MACCKQTEVVPPKPIPCTLRIILINDVYNIDNLPYLLTAKKQELKGADMIITVLAGDFLSPSLLSSLDKGVGMIDCLGAAGVDYVCFGNHEADLTIQELHSRIKESKFTWLNSNMPNFPLAVGMSPLPKYKVLEVEGKTQKRKVALIGLVTEDPKSYKGTDRFSSSIVDPVNAAAIRWNKELKGVLKVDTVIPITHQDISSDRKLAEMKIGFPIILGGHDHNVYNEKVVECKILKTGMNADTFGIVDIVWESPESTNLSVSVNLKPAKTYVKDPTVESLVQKHKYCLEQLEKSELFALPMYNTLSTKNALTTPASMATFLLTVVRQIMKADCVLLSGGSFKGDCDYAGKQYFTYADLKTEFFYDTNMIVLPLPGSVIAEAIQFTRAGVFKSPPEYNNSYLQTDDGISWYAIGNSVLNIAGQVLEPAKIYNCAVNYLVAFKSMDNVEPLVKYVTEQVKANNPAFMKDYDSTTELKQLMVTHYAKLILFNMVSPQKVLAMDVDHDGVITKEEFLNYAKELHGSTELSSLLVENLFNIADLDGDSKIDKKEMNYLLKMGTSSYVEVTPIGEVFTNITGFFTTLSGQTSDIGNQLTKTFSFSPSDVSTINGVTSTTSTFTTTTTTVM